MPSQRYLPFLEWIDAQREPMVATLRAWGNVNSGTFHTAGLAQQCDLLHGELSFLGGALTVLESHPHQVLGSQGELLEVALGRHLHVVQRADAERRVLLAIHMDTVYPVDSPFQSVEEIGSNTLRGPGVCDAKGGLVVMVYALRAFEQFVETTGNVRLGWEVLVNSDEEIGSPGSGRLIEECARRAQLGLVFEPTLPDGHLVSSRKGSGSFSIRVRGRSAHAGRDFHHGRNAIVSAASIATQLHGLNGLWPEMTLNVARIEGGGPTNVVPDLAIIRFNIRYSDPSSEPEILQALETIVAQSGSEGIQVLLHGQFSSAPKVLDERGERMLEAVRDCGLELGLDLHWQPSGGACDGNRLAACGVPNVDALGVRGGRIHSPEEFVLLDSLTERAKLTALFLMRLADGDFADLWAATRSDES